MKSDAILKKYLTAEHAEIAEIILIFFLSVLPPGLRHMASGS